MGIHEYLYYANDVSQIVSLEISMCFETVFFNLQKWNYWLDISNILEIGMFVTALIAVSVDSERSKLSFTVLAILLAFLTLLSYQQR